MTHIIGIDPGKAGGIAAINADETTVEKMPETVGDLADHLRSLAVLGYCTAYVERVHSSPQMGVVSAFTFGRGLGNIEAVCQCLGISLVWITPSVWQRELGCMSKGDKNVTKRRAQELFPNLKVTHSTADALLIAEYGMRKEKGNNA
jgi:crossover junction endodeoxyribonuclease RuvC